MAVPMPPRPPVAPGAPKKSLIPEVLDIPKYGAEALRKIGVPETKGRLITGQGITTAVQAGLNMIGQPLLNFLVNGAGGLFFLVGSLFDIFPDNTTAMAVGWQMLAKTVDPSPEEMEKLKKNIDLFVEGLKELNADKILKSLVRSEKEVKGFLSSLGLPMPSVTVPTPVEKLSFEVVETKPTTTTTTVTKKVEEKELITRRRTFR